MSMFLNLFACFIILEELIVLLLKRYTNGPFRIENWLKERYQQRTSKAKGENSAS